MRLLLLFSFASILVTAAAAASETNNDDPLISNFPALVSWFRSHGGTIDPRITIGYEPPRDESKADVKIRGMIATSDIPAETLLIHCPASLVLHAEGNGQCFHIERTIFELKLGNQSKWHAYFQFDDTMRSRVPTQWSRDANGAGGRAVLELQGLPPSGETHSHLDWYRGSCKNGEEMDELDWRALMMFLTRAADMGFVPMYGPFILGF